MRWSKRRSAASEALQPVFKKKKQKKTPTRLISVLSLPLIYPFKAKQLKSSYTQTKVPITSRNWWRRYWCTTVRCWSTTVRYPEVLSSGSLDPLNRVLKVPLWDAAAVNRQPADTPSQRGTRITRKNLWKGVRFLNCSMKPECPEKDLPKWVWNRQTKFTYNYWQAAFLTGKCSSTKTTRLATRVVRILIFNQYLIPIKLWTE